MEALNDFLYNFVGLALFQIVRIAPFSFLRYYPFRHHFRFSVPIILTGYFTIMLLEIVAVYHYGDSIRPWGNIAFHVGYIAYSLIAIRASLPKQFFVIFLLAIYQMAMTAISITAGVYSSYWEEDWLRGFLLYAAIVGVTFYPALRFAKTKLSVVLEYESDIWSYLWFMPFSLYGLQMFYTPINNQFTLLTSIGRVMAAMVAFVGCIVLIYSVESIKNREKLEAELKLNNKLLEAERQQLQVLQEHNTEMRRLRHDIKHHLNYLDHAVEHKQYKELAEYLGKLQTVNSKLTIPRVCANDALDALMQYWIKNMHEYGAATEVLLQVPAKLTIDDFDLSSLMGNLLENTLDATRLLPRGQGKASVKLKLVGSLLLITVDNVFNGQYRVQEGLYQSHKRDYLQPGIGLQNVQRIVEKYEGHLKIAQLAEEFQVSVMLKMPPAEETEKCTDSKQTST